jgi:hypothetical protein
MREKLLAALSEMCDANRHTVGACCDAANDRTRPGLHIGLEAAHAAISSAIAHLTACLRIIDSEPPSPPRARVRWEEFEAAFRRLYQRD